MEVRTTVTAIKLDIPTLLTILVIMIIQIATETNVLCRAVLAAIHKPPTTVQTLNSAGAILPAARLSIPGHPQVI